MRVRTPCLFAAALGAIAAPALGQVTLPYTFTAGTPILSAQVNADFQTLVNGLNTPNGTAYVLNRGCCGAPQTGAFNLTGPSIIGNLGGVTSVSDRLTIAIGSPGTVDDGITIMGSTSTYGDLGLKINNTGPGGNLWYLDSTSTGSGYGAGSLAFVNGFGSTPTLLLSGTGYVGIGTASPTDNLNVNIGAAGPVNNGITIQGSTSTYGDLGLKINNTGTGGNLWFIDSTNNGSGYGGGRLAFVAGIGAAPTMTLSASAPYALDLLVPNQPPCSFPCLVYPGLRIRGDGSNRAWPNLTFNDTSSGAEWVFGMDSVGDISLGQPAPTGGSIYLAAGTGSVLLSGAHVGIGTTAPDSLLTVNGTADKPGGGSWGTFSDERLKNIKGPYARGLKELMEIEPVRYEYKDDNALGLVSTGEHVGFGAQALERVLPEAVSQNAQGYRIVDNDPILWTMLNAIKEQQRELQAQQREIETLRAELSARRAEPESR